VVEEQAIREVIHEMIDAFNEHDARRSSRVFTADGDLATVRGEWFHGAAEIEKGLETVFATRARAACLKQIDTTIRFIRPDVALAHVKNELSGLIGSDGQNLPAHVEFSLRVLVKEGHQWRVAAMHNRRVDVAVTATLA
jgi:uncharacterized protein (TIGR02246 family)